MTNDYQAEVDSLIEGYIQRLERNEQQQKLLLSHKKTLKLLHADGDYPYKKKLSNQPYQQTLEALQLELVKAQYWIQKTQQKVAVLFEGRDAAGKGGTIKRFMLNLNPRHAKVVALTKPTDYEQSQWYFQRYIKHLPASGEVAFFDRSWYNRAGVERVMGFCTDEQYQRFMKEVSRLEQQWVHSGIKLIKYWLDVSRLEQLRRFRARQTNPLRRWKLSLVDIDSLDKWDAYTEASQAMLEKTSHLVAPWHIVMTDDKKRARLACIQHFLSQLDYPNKNTVLLDGIDRKIIRTYPTHNQKAL